MAQRRQGNQGNYATWRQMFGQQAPAAAPRPAPRAAALVPEEIVEAELQEALDTAPAFDALPANHPTRRLLATRPELAAALGLAPVAAPPALPAQSVKPFNTEENYSSLLECSVCFTNIKDIRLDCGHMVCGECANMVQTCPICREPITRRDKVYYNKYLKYKMKYFSLKNKTN